MTTQGDGAEDAYNRFNVNILTPLYQSVNTFVNEDFETREEVTKELEAMKLVKKRLQQQQGSSPSSSSSGSEFKLATLNLYIWELENNLKEYNEGR